LWCRPIEKFRHYEWVFETRCVKKYGFPSFLDLPFEECEKYIEIHLPTIFPPFC
jgi:hypothetical protein